MKRCTYIIFFITILTSHCRSQWSTDPTQNLIVGYGLLPELCTDSAGGCYITYEQNTTYPRQLILERLNRYGYKPWGGNKKLQGLFPEQSGTKIVEDGAGGVIVAYLDEYDSGMSAAIRLRAQRVDSSGSFLWGIGGIRISLLDTNQYDEQIVTDGKNGCIVAWFEGNTVRMQHVNNAGARMWGDSGFVIGVLGSRVLPMISDGEAGCIINVGGTIHRLDSGGTRLWSPGGVAAESSAGASMVSDEHGGAIFAGMRWISYNNGDPCYAAIGQKVDSAGRLLWGPGGLTLDDSIQNIVLNPPAIVLENNSDGGATFAWNKRTHQSKLRTFMQRVRSNGSVVFADGAEPVSLSDSLGNGPWAILTSLGSSKIFVLADGRFGGSVFAQRTDSLGNQLWSNTDAEVSQRPLGYVNAISDGNGGFILVGFDQSEFSVRVQQCSYNGVLGEILAPVGEPSVKYFLADFVLYQNYPNPFNSRTVIQYNLPKSGRVRIDVYNVLGEFVVNLVSKFQTPGKYSINFDAGDLPSGIYFYELEVKESFQVHKLTILK